jgi:hypothetical protein
MRRLPLLLSASLAVLLAPPALAQETGRDGSGCAFGYRVWGARCIPIRLPLHAELDEDGHGWVCHGGFRRIGEGCLPIRRDRALAHDGRAEPDCGDGLRFRAGRCLADEPPLAAPAAPPEPVAPAPREWVPMVAPIPSAPLFPNEAEPPDPAPERVWHVQAQLASLGYYEGPVDGRLDAATQASIRRFQERAGAVPDGRIGMDLYERLRAEYDFCVVTRSLAADPSAIDRSCGRGGGVAALGPPPVTAR